MHVPLVDLAWNDLIFYLFLFILMKDANNYGGHCDLHETDINFRYSFSCIDFTPSGISPTFLHRFYPWSTMEWFGQTALGVSLHLLSLSDYRLNRQHYYPFSLLKVVAVAFETFPKSSVTFCVHCLKVKSIFIYWVNRSTGSYVEDSWSTLEHSGWVGGELRPHELLLWDRNKSPQVPVNTKQCV